MVAVPQMVPRRRLTLEDYEALPGDQDYEVIEGGLYVAPRPRPRHQLVASRIVFLLMAELQQRGLGVVLPDADLAVDDQGTYVSPDVMYFTVERFKGVDPDRMVAVIPDLVVEVLSPLTEDYDRITKRATYAKLGIPHYWLVDADRRRLHELVLQPDGTYAERRIGRRIGVAETFTPALFPQLTVDLSLLLAE